MKTLNLKAREEARRQLRNQFNNAPPFPGAFMLTWQQIKDMVAMGMEIGGHTLTHCNLPNAGLDDAWREIRQCKLLLEERLGIEIKHFAYPNGGSSQYYDEGIKDLVRQAGFVSACTSQSGCINIEHDLLELSRIRTTGKLRQILREIEACTQRTG
jgi:peptidoglycan/xylan/chitin deacetylase (PgdA/CDA1 family)